MAISCSDYMKQKKTSRDVFWLLFGRQAAFIPAAEGIQRSPRSLPPGLQAFDQFFHRTSIGAGAI
jgi:hypothetical protein